jgi:serine/threonine protein kinase
MAELETVQFLVDNLKIRDAGDFKILVNCTLRVNNRGSSGAYEIDLILVCKLGVFLMEVKSDHGVIEGHENREWQSNGRPMPGDANPLTTIERKAQVLHSALFRSDGRVSDLRGVYVAGLVVLPNAIYRHKPPNKHPKRVTGLDTQLLDNVRKVGPVIREDSRRLETRDVDRIIAFIYGENDPVKEEYIGRFQVLREFSDEVAKDENTLYTTIEVIDPQLSIHRLVKRYRLVSLTTYRKENMRLFERGAKAVSQLGGHPHIVQTIEYFQDRNREDTFYEVTELFAARRLDTIIAEMTDAMPLQKQLNYLIPVCEALKVAHEWQQDDAQGIYHRNVSTQSIYLNKQGVVKLGDFNYAKMVGQDTVMGFNQSLVEQSLVENIFTAPEIRSNPSDAKPTSDIYSLGVVWLVLASLPNHDVTVDVVRVEGLDLPQAAKDLLGHMLNKIESNRPQSVGEVLAVLNTLRE